MRQNDVMRAARRSEGEIKGLSPGLGTESQATVSDGGTFIDSALLLLPPPRPAHHLEAGGGNLGCSNSKISPSSQHQRYPGNEQIPLADTRAQLVPHSLCPIPFVPQRVEGT